MQCKLYKFCLLILIIPALLVGGCRSEKGKRKPGLLDDSETKEIVDRIETIKLVYHLSPSMLLNYLLMSVC